MVVEVDGSQHFAEDGKPSLVRYADMVAADRDLRLAGYEVYRFGANELTGHGSAERIEAFFRPLLRKHAVLPGAGSAGVRSGRKALSYIGLAQGSTPPLPRRSSNLSARTRRNPHPARTARCQAIDLQQTA